MAEGMGGGGVGGQRGREVVCRNVSRCVCLQSKIMNVGESVGEFFLPT